MRGVLVIVVVVVVVIVIVILVALVFVIVLHVPQVCYMQQLLQPAPCAHMLLGKRGARTAVARAFAVLVGSVRARQDTDGMDRGAAGKGKGNVG